MFIINSYHKKLSLQAGDKTIGISPNEVIFVENEIGKILIENPWIQEVKEKAPVFERCGIPIGSCEPCRKGIKKQARETVSKIQSTKGREKKLNKD